MKKLLCLVLVLLLPVFAFADGFELDEFTCYAHTELTETGAPYMSVIYFAPDGTCFYLAQMFLADEPGLHRAYVGTWEYTSDGCVYAKIGDNTDTTFKPVEFLGDVTLVERGTLQVYSPFDVLMN